MSGGKFFVFTSSYVNTALDQSAIRIHKCYIINIYICIPRNVQYMMEDYTDTNDEKRR